MIKKIEHTAIIVKNLEESIHYYTTIFGMSLRTKGDNKQRSMAFLYFETDPAHEIELIQDLQPGAEYAAAGIVNHLAFTVENMEEAVRFYEGKGIEFHTDKPNVAIDGAKTSFFTGPNGELLQLVEPVR